MFDIGWSELLLIAVVAVVVIGPKDLPNAMRSMGKTIRGVRRMASDFQAQFNEALREAELDDLRREVAELRDTARGLVRQVDVSSVARDELEGIRQSIDAKEAEIGTKTAEASYEAADAAAAGEAALPEPPPLDEPELPLEPAPEEPPSVAAVLAESLAPRVEPIPDAAREPAPPHRDVAPGGAHELAPAVEHGRP